MSDIDLIDYALPPERIAQKPTGRREASRLLVLDRSRGATEHHRFHDVTRFLRRGDLLVVNDTRVVPARLRARRPTGGAVEMLLLEERPETPGTWRVLLRPGKFGREGNTFSLDGADAFTAQAVGREGDVFLVQFREDGRLLERAEVFTVCEAVGETPLPPYIKRQPADTRFAEDRDRYQTVYADQPGAVAAPTAGLHFTEPLLDRIAEQGVERVSLTLHVGLDTFKPLTKDELETGKLHGERVAIGNETGEKLLAARAAGRRIVAVGTTCVRALESFAASTGTLPYRERTTLFIRPGHTFRMVDALITNFHLPRSSLLLLVSALAGRETVLRAYEEAIAEEYRFYSYGDAMMIV